jgi:hypothetical protein
VTALGLGAPALSWAEGFTRPSLGKSGAHWACPHGACDAIVVSRTVKLAGGDAVPGSTHILAGTGERKGLAPADLVSAYKIPATLAAPVTVAVIDAYGYPDAESDLAA